MGDASPRVASIVVGVGLAACALAAGLVALGLPGLARVATPGGAAAFAFVGVAYFFLQRYGGEIPSEGGQRSFYSLEDIAVGLSLVALPPAAIPFAAAAACLVAQVLDRRAGVKVAFNLSAHVGAASLVALVHLALLAAGAPLLLAVALALPLYALYIDATLALVFARIEERRYLSIIREMATGGTLQGAAFALALGVTAASLWLAHPLAVLVLVPLFAMARRHLVLTGRAQRELTKQKELAEKAVTLAQCHRLPSLADALAEGTLRLLPAGHVEVALWPEGHDVHVSRADDRGPDLARAPITTSILDPGSRVVGHVRAHVAFGVKEDFREADRRTLETLCAEAGATVTAILAVDRLEEAYRMQGVITATALAATAESDVGVLLATLTGRVRDSLQAQSVAVVEETAAGWMVRASSGALDMAALAPQLPRPGDPRVAAAPIDDGAGGATYLCAVGARDLRAVEREHLASAALVVSTAMRRRRMEDALRRSERLTALGTLVAGVAHEINNPLTYVRGNIELVEMDADEAPTDERRKLLASALQGVSQIERITAALKQVARAPRGAQGAEDVEGLLGAALAVAGARWKGNVTSHVDARARRHAWASGPELSQVLLNLLLNAGEAMGEAGGEVFVRTRDVDGDVVIEIEDTGPGISPHDQEKLFTPFFTTKTHGTGLGLSLSRELVETMGGELTFQSPPGRGATFSIRLAAAPAKAVARST